MDPPSPSLTSPYQLMGNDEKLVRELVSAFYRHMATAEPALAATHELDERGFITERTQLRFSNFLIEWLGGPQRYTPQNGHPRLRMRHAHVPIDSQLRDAWLRCMSRAFDEVGVSGDVRAFLDRKFEDVADFLRNRADRVT